MKNKIIKHSSIILAGITLALSFLPSASAGVVKATDYEYASGTFPTKGWNSNSAGTVEISNLEWSYNAVPYIGYSNGGIQIGSKNSPLNSTFTLKASVDDLGDDAEIHSVSFEGSSKNSATYDISVNGTSYGTGSLATTSAIYTANSIAEDSGDIVISITSESTTAYLASIKISYSASQAGAQDTYYTVTYNANGGTGADITHSVVENGVETLPQNTFVAPQGMRFNSWNTQADGKGNRYLVGETFTVSSDKTIYAIWEDIPQPHGDVYTMATSVDDLKVNDQYLFVYFKEANLPYVNGGIDGNSLCYAQAEFNSPYLYYSSLDVQPLTLGGVDGNYTFSYQDGENTITLAVSAKNTMANLSSKTDGLWDISFNSDNTVNVANTKTEWGKMQFNVSRFSCYASSQSPIYLFHKSSETPEVIMESTEVQGVVDDVLTLSVKELKGIENPTYSWSVLDGTVCGIISDKTQSSVQVKLSKAGTTTVKVLVNERYAGNVTVTVIDCKYDILTADKYFIANYDKTAILIYDSEAVTTTKISYTNSIDFSNENMMWTFKKAYKGDNTYYIKRAEGTLADAKSAGVSGGSSKLGTTQYDIQYYTVTKNADNSVTLTCSSNTHPCIAWDSSDSRLGWNSYAEPTGTQAKLYLLGQLAFKNISYSGTLARTTYNVGDTFDPTGLTFFATYEESTETTPINVTNITWSKITKGTTATGYVTIGNYQKEVIVSGLTITNYLPTGISITNQPTKVSYRAGESVDTTGMEVTLNMFDSEQEAGSQSSTRVLNSEEYFVSPRIVNASTEKLTISYALDTTLTTTVDISVEENQYVAANSIKVGDKVVLGTEVGYANYNITGGYEMALDNSGNVSCTGNKFDYLPNGDLFFDVCQGATAGTFALKYGSSYLEYNDKSVTLGAVDWKNYSKNGQNKYVIGTQDYPISFTGISGYNGVATTVFTETSEGSNYFGSTPFYSGQLMIQFTAEVVGNTFKVTAVCYPDMLDPTVSYETVFTYNCQTNGALSIDWNSNATVTVGEKNSFTFEFVEAEDKRSGTWSISCGADDLLINEDSGKLAKTGTKNVMVYRDNTIALKSKVNSISVETPEVDSFKKGDLFNWGNIVVKANYEGGINGKIVPLGGYEIELPETNVIGSATGRVIYGPTNNKVEKTFGITVTGNTTTLNIVKKTLSIPAGTSVLVEYTTNAPADEPLVWTVDSTNPIVTVNQEGLVTAGNVTGTTTVTVTSRDGTLSDSITITVVKVVDAIQIPSAKEISVGESAKLDLAIMPLDANDYQQSWKSSNSTTVEVDKKGNITGLRTGSATITVTVISGGRTFTDTCEVTVIEAIVEEITLNSTKQTLEVGNTFTLTVTFNPTYATNKNLIWTSSNENVAKVEDGVVTALSAGTANIKVVSAVNGNAAAICKITVKNPVEPEPPITDDDNTDSDTDVDNTDTGSTSAPSIKLGCQLSVVSSSLVVSISTLVGGYLLLSKKRKENK